MSCSELGFDGEYGLRVSKSADSETILTFPDSVDFAGYDGSFVIKAELDDASAELTVGTTATANGSVMVFSENTILVRLKALDLQSLPLNASDPADPWVGWFEWIVTDPDGLTSRLFQLPLIAERGAAE
jgi:hypothetical protein